MKSICSTCKRETNHEILSEEKYNYSEETGWWEDHRYQIIQCKGCDTISFRKLYSDAASGGAIEHGINPWTQELFPKRTLTSLPIKNLLNTPQNIKKIYRETIDAFNNGQSILCSGGLRAIIEGVCKQRGISKGEVDNGKGGKKMSNGLDGKIEALASNGFLTQENANILHELRFLGNAALHELSSPSNNELKMAIEIIEHTLDNLYEFEHKAKELRKEIAKRKK
ncbi:hypothetical protein GGR42_003418 [Saonia flava]|uniref:DUF4145 domain-containing protein n=1 Tax=Saonia flava TaxID=523696 RepID=A0A846R183_9FLAO|nr:DUF4145 domain-containing protein [Saonia flava]NJB72920.1 hypothetical protein [Saonia flava]